MVELHTVVHYMLIALLVVAGIHRKQELQQAEIVPLLEAALQEQSWPRPQNHKLVRHNLSSSSFLHHRLLDAQQEAVEMSQLQTQEFLDFVGHKDPAEDNPP